MSHPSWVCGLKLIVRVSAEGNDKSHPSWVCGLKLVWRFRRVGRISHTLRGCVDWNKPCKPIMLERLGHTLRGCVDWNSPVGYRPPVRRVTPFVGVWIETAVGKSEFTWSDGHTLRGCVDWNRCTSVTTNREQGHTLRGCVDWNLSSKTAPTPLSCHTLRGCVDWNSIAEVRKDTGKLSHPSWVCGLKQI